MEFIRFNNVTKQYKTAVSFIKDSNVTIDLLIDLYLLYKKADMCKSESEENRFPIPYYLIDAFAKFECNDRTPQYIAEQLNNSNEIVKIIKLYTAVTKTYTSNFNENNIVDYNNMIKQPVNYQLLTEFRSALKSAIDIL